MQDKKLYSLTEEGIHWLATFLEREFTIEPIKPADINVKKYKQLSKDEQYQLCAVAVLWNTRNQKLESLTEEEIIEQVRHFSFEVSVSICVDEGAVEVIEKDGNEFIGLTESGEADVLAKFMTDKTMRQLAYRLMIATWVQEDMPLEKRKASVERLMTQWTTRGTMTRKEILEEFQEESDALKEEFKKLAGEQDNG